METRLKDRLETLIDISNKIYNQAICCEVDMVYFNQLLLSPFATKEEIAKNKAELQARINQKQTCEKLIHIIKHLIDDELKKIERKEKN